MTGRLPLLLALGLFVNLLAGCGAYRPSFGPAGTVEQQRLGAAIHDPYAVDELGPDVEGGRPRDFQKPLAEPVRNRWFADRWLGR